jgi:hypothetical protein
VASGGPRPRRVRRSGLAWRGLAWPLTPPGGGRVGEDRHRPPTSPDASGTPHSAPRPSGVRLLGPAPAPSAAPGSHPVAAPAQGAAPYPPRAAPGPAGAGSGGAAGGGARRLGRGSRGDAVGSASSRGGAPPSRPRRSGHHRARAQEPRSRRALGGAGHLHRRRPRLRVRPAPLPGPARAGRGGQSRSSPPQGWLDGPTPRTSRCCSWGGRWRDSRDRSCPLPFAPRRYSARSSRPSLPRHLRPSRWGRRSRSAPRRRWSWTGRWPSRRFPSSPS